MKTNCFPRENRILQSKQFKNVFSSKRKSVSKYFVVLSVLNDVNLARLGLIVAKKYVKKAVGRNRLKRLIRESFRHQDFLSDLDLVVIVRHQAGLCDNKQLRKQLEKQWKAIAGYYKNP